MRSQYSRLTRYLRFPNGSKTAVLLGSANRLLVGAKRTTCGRSGAGDGGAAFGDAGVAGADAAEEMMAKVAQAL